RRRHTRSKRDWSSDVCSSDLSWHRHGFYYRAALATERVLGARTLASTLNQVSPRPVARAIKKMHDAGVFHADLNAFNILLDAERSEERRVGKEWRLRVTQDT